MSRPRVIGKTRASSDEQYVLDLCDGVLNQRADRGHRFAWLVGDPGKNGRRARLPVDAYYKDLGMVIEYREDQHYQPGPKHWNKATISGMPRDNQRRRYDLLRDNGIPAHGLYLVIIRPRDLDATRGGRLRRSRVSDLNALRLILRERTT
jgi:hypothetical protein